MSQDFKLPEQGLVFWPVGTGDCTTIAISSDIILQVDIRQSEAARDIGSCYEPVVDRLIELLPKRDGRPYLACFALTHPDQDHCQGFEELLDRVDIGELWFTPRVFREYNKDLCDDAVVFKREALRRVNLTIQNRGMESSGDRVRIIGYHDLLGEQKYNGFPERMLTVPGNAITSIDGIDLSGQFRAFVHAPFKVDVDCERNDSSLGLQVSLSNGVAVLRSLLLGDLAYPTLHRIFKVSEDSNLAWNVLLAPHHCSKSAMYWREEFNEDETLRQDILHDLERVQECQSHIVASSDPVPTTNKPGDNPPHAKAKARYQEIVGPEQFYCTQGETPGIKPKPLVFTVDQGLVAATTSWLDSVPVGMGLVESVNLARGGIAPPTEQVGFGKHD